MHSKEPPVARKFTEDGPFELRFERNCDLTPATFVGKTEGAERTGCWTPFINAHMRKDDASTAITWAVLRNNYC